MPILAWVAHKEVVDMTGERFKIIIKNYNYASDAFDEQNDYCVKYRDKTQCKITLEMFENSKQSPLRNIRQSMNNLKMNRADLNNQYKLVKQLAYYQDILIDERSSIRIEKRYDELCLEYDKLILNSIKRIQSLIDAIIRS